MKFKLPLLALLLLRAACPQDQSRAIFQEIGKDLDELAQISGLKLRKPVPYDLISRDDVNKFLKQRMKEVAKPGEIRAEEITLKKFGLVPQDFDLAKTTVDLLTEQAAAFYDFSKKKLYITDWTASATRDAALVHELAHALADQNFHLERYIKEASKSDDASLAHMAVMEGQATWLMSEYLARKSGQSLLDSPSLVAMMSRADAGGSGYPVFEGAPLYLRETLVFPYTKGMLFQNAIVEKIGKAGFAEVFRHAPISTQQILHPDKYFDQLRPTSPELPHVDLKGFKPLIEGTVGELDHAILIEQFAGRDQAQSLSPHWKGARYLIFEDKRRTRTVLTYASEWDTLEAAHEYMGIYRQAMSKKWSRMEIRSEAPDLLTGTGDDGAFELRLKGAVVTSIEGL